MMQNLITVIAPQILVAGAYSFVGEIRSVVFELPLDACSGNNHGML